MKFLFLIIKRRKRKERVMKDGKKEIYKKDIEEKER